MHLDGNYEAGRRLPRIAAPYPILPLLIGAADKAILIDSLVGMLAIVLPARLPQWLP
jgi:hypothetical protein